MGGLIGLTIVRMIAESIGCKVSFVEPGADFSTAFKFYGEKPNEENIGL